MKTFRELMKGVHRATRTHLDGGTVVWTHGFLTQELPVLLADEFIDREPADDIGEGVLRTFRFTFDLEDFESRFGKSERPKVDDCVKHEGCEFAIGGITMSAGIAEVTAINREYLSRMAAGEDRRGGS